MRAPKRAPSPRWSSIMAPRCEGLITISPMPARTRFWMCQTIRGLPRTGSKGLGQASVNGRMGSPRPAAKMMAFMASESVADLRRVLFQAVEQPRQGRQFAVAGAGLAGVLQHQRHVLQIGVLAVAV